MPNFDAILENYGVQRTEGVVFEGDNQHYAMQMPYYLVPTINSTDASSETASAGYYVLAPYAFWKICTIALIPGIFLVIGFVVWIKRRKA